MAAGSSRPDDSTEPQGLARGLPAALWQLTTYHRLNR